ncbi:MAG: hypothetical protein Gaeavirus11_8 [Gaeavirus sp.]|uniref:Uncharacterized protein n=1 Tax=Gaeavirus sp. TaxID=2487767 RepID=A0A3G4ZYZ7_9VIRU|nr:MAG: hypothetical protein Gaeavirus11_8 [Gaeavirus sp.]
MNHTLESMRLKNSDIMETELAFESKFNKVLNEISDSEDEDELIDAPDVFDNYIIKESIQRYNINAQFCKFTWNGTYLIDRWELQRKVDISHAKYLVKSMISDYKKYGEFIFYEPIHLIKKSDSKYYVIDGQHRLEAYNFFHTKNKYPIQQVPCIIWYTHNNITPDEDFITLFDKINSRVSIDRHQLHHYKILDIINEMETKYGKLIWGLKRPRINKDIFILKINENDNIHDLILEDIMDKIYEININIRALPRTKRPRATVSLNKSAETLDFFLGLDKKLSWIDDI